MELKQIEKEIRGIRKELNALQAASALQQIAYDEAIKKLSLISRELQCHKSK